MINNIYGDLKVEQISGFDISFVIDLQIFPLYNSKFEKDQLREVKKKSVDKMRKIAD